MKKLSLSIVLVLSIGTLTGYMFREPLREAVDAWTTRDMFVSVDAATFQPGPEIGQRLPDLQADHKGRSITSIEQFYRGNGAVLIALRSLDWCPYCKRQMIDLQKYKHKFEIYGIGLVAITYDHPDAQQPFIEKHGITIPVLSDSQSRSFSSLGILNNNFQPGDTEYGIPHPGAIVVNREGEVTGKLFVEDPDFRVYSTGILDYSKQSLKLKGLF